MKISNVFSQKLTDFYWIPVEPLLFQTCNFMLLKKPPPRPTTPPPSSTSCTATIHWKNHQWPSTPHCSNDDWADAADDYKNTQTNLCGGAWATSHMYVSKGSSFLDPLKFFDGVRWTNITLDVLLECQIDYFWNVNGDRQLSWPRTGFVHFTSMNNTPPQGYTWSRGRLANMQATSRPEQSTYGQKFCQMCQRIPSNKKNRIGQNKKPKLDKCTKAERNLPHRSGRLGIQWNLKNAGKKLELRMKSAMPCKSNKNWGNWSLEGAEGSTREMLRWAKARRDSLQRPHEEMQSYFRM